MIASYGDRYRVILNTIHLNTRVTPNSDWYKSQVDICRLRRDFLE